jgi:hypothetical protein
VFDRLLNQPPYSLRQSEKEAVLLEGLNELTRFHYEKSREYARIIDAAWGGPRAYDSIPDVPYLPVSLFKEMELKSTAQPAMVMRRAARQASERAGSSSTMRPRAVNRRRWWRRSARSWEAVVCHSSQSTRKT